MTRAHLVTEILRRKRDGKALATDEISFLVEGFARGTIPDYQATAWLMAVFLKGFDDRETVDLTRAMKDSGRTLAWRQMSASFKNAVFVDKHSTGGVGDKVSLVLAPVAACLGLKVPMMSGRGLGHTGGTVDKLQSIPGFDMFPKPETMIRCLDEIGICMMAQAPDLCPADRKLYALRDVTATVESIPLITASIVSKKWAEGVDAIVYDVKVGSGAFMEDLDRARALSESLCRVSALAGLKARACLTRMEEPLGSRVGNALEVEECLWILERSYPTPEHERLARPLVDLILRLAAEMALVGGTRLEPETALSDARAALESGRALEIFERMVRAQGGIPGWREKIHDHLKKFTVAAPRSGYLKTLRSRELGLAGLLFGVGRERAEDTVDPGTGFELAVQPGDRIEAGAPLAHVFAHDASVLEKIRPFLDRAFEIGADPSSRPKTLLIERYPQ